MNKIYIERVTSKNRTLEEVCISLARLNDNLFTLDIVDIIQRTVELCQKWDEIVTFELYSETLGCYTKTFQFQDGGWSEM